MYFFIMKSVSYTEFRKNLASYFDKVENDRIPMLITHCNGRR